MEEELGIRLRANGVVETTDGIDLVGDATTKLGTKLNEQQQIMRRARAEGNQLREAYRQLPMQITDVVTSLASGMPVWMVAIQQGGQIRDAFGGIQPAVQGLLSVLSPLRLAAGGAGLGLGVLALAYRSVLREEFQYRQSIVLTGNAAGVTAGQLGDMARRVSQVSGTQSEAASVLASLVGSGRVAASELQAVTETALRLESVAGIAIAKTVGQFVALGKDPVKASVALNESTNFLTVSLYEQIRALEERGRKREAAALAESTYAAAMKSRADELQASLGLVERSWNAVTGAAKGAWDAMLDMGREQTLQQQLDAVTQALALPAQRGRNPLQADQRREALRQRQGELQELQRLERRSAEMQASQAAATRDAIAKRESERNKKPGANPADRLDESIQRRLALAQAELQAGEQLSQADRFRVELLRQIDEVQGKIGAKRAGELRTQVESTAQQMRTVQAQREQLKAREALDKQFNAERLAATKAAYAEIEQIEKRNAALADETAVIGLSADALQARRQAQLDATIADREAHIARIDGLPGYAEEAAALRQQIELLQQRKGLQQQKFVAEERQKEIEENKKRQDDLTDSITNGMLEGFRNGQSIAEAFRRELVGQFAATILRPSVKILVDQVYDGGSGGLFGSLLSGIGGLLSGSGGGSTAMDTGFYGGGLAGGGRARAGRMYEVNEEGPEVISVGKRSYLMMGAQDGQVTPTSRGRGGGSGGGGRGITFAPTYVIDSRTDRAEVVALVQRASRQSQAELLEMMERGQV